MPQEVSYEITNGHPLWLPSTVGGGFQSNLHPTIASGSGVWAVDVDGRRYLDANSGLWHLSLGYGYPQVAEAVKDAAVKLGGSSLFRRSHVWANDLAYRIADSVPLGAGTKVFFATSGSEAADAAMRIAFSYHSPRPRIAYIAGAYHGVSLGPLSLMGLSGYRNGSPTAMEAIELPGIAAWTAAPDATRADVEQIFRKHGERIAAVFVEPIQGSGGVLQLPSQYARLIRMQASAYGILVVADAIACGVYRSGHGISSELGSVLVPDIVLIGKGLSGGVAPLSAVLVEKSIAEELNSNPATDRLPGTTHSGGPIACAAALATLQALEEPHSTALRASTATELANLLPRLRSTPGVADVRGSGHMWGIELDTNIAPRTGETTWVRDITALAADRRLLIHPLSVGVIPVFPALVATRSEVADLVHRLDDCITALATLRNAQAGQQTP